MSNLSADSGPDGGLEDSTGVSCCGTLLFSRFSCFFWSTTWYNLIQQYRRSYIHIYVYTYNILYMYIYICISYIYGPHIYIYIIISYQIIFYHITSHHITSHHITSHHITSHIYISYYDVRCHIAFLCQCIAVSRCQPRPGRGQDVLEESFPTASQWQYGRRIPGISHRNVLSVGHN